MTTLTCRGSSRRTRGRAPRRRVRRRDRSLLPPEYRTEAWLGVHIPGLGVLLTLLIVFITGVFGANIIGARLVNFWHEVLHRIPASAMRFMRSISVCCLRLMRGRMCKHPAEA
ncbi:MAG: DUF502 domain-containing protein [Chloroflexi bacterium]|nr:DUF502 domain-containing protein [Chloroflexota bacterium]